MGLLDFASDPEGMQGLSLLAAAGPSMEPANFASRLAMAGNTYRGLLKDQLNQQLTKAQMEALMQQTQLGSLQLEQAKQQWELQQPLLQGLVTRMSGAPAAAPTQPAIAPTQGGPMGSGTFGMSVGGQPASAPAASGGAGGSIIPGVPDDVTRWTVATGGLKGIPALMTEYNKPTDFQKMLTAAGVDPQSPLGRQLIQQNLAKQNYIAPVNARPGSILRDPTTNQPVAFNPHIPDGSTPTFDAAGNVVGLRPLNGAYQAISAAETAKGMGTAEATPTVAYDASGNPVFSTKANDVRRAAPPSGVSLDASKGQFAILTQERNKAVQAGNAADVAAIDREIARLPASARSGGNSDGIAVQPSSLTPVPKLGAQQASNLSQEELSKKGTSLMNDNSQTNTVIGRLQNIKMLAPGAITGGETGRRDYFNALLALAGIKGANDAKTASDLVDKNASQIVSALRMGQGGAGTDALQSLLSAANPNRHMTNDAIQEAADQLIASQKMIQDKARVLQQHYLARDPVAYGQKEMQFDQNADPRIWQLQSMTPQQQAAYVKTLPPAVASDLLTKRRALKEIGAIK